MAQVRMPNIDEQGNFLNPDVIARLSEKFGAAGGGGITAQTTLDEAALAENGA